MACSAYKDGKCKSGFPVTPGCWATGKLEKSMMKYVHCTNEEWQGAPYDILTNGVKRNDTPEWISDLAK